MSEDFEQGSNWAPRGRAGGRGRGDRGGSDAGGGGGFGRGSGDGGRSWQGSAPGADSWGRGERRGFEDAPPPRGRAGRGRSTSYPSVPEAAPSAFSEAQFQDYREGAPAGENAGERGSEVAAPSEHGSGEARERTASVGSRGSRGGGRGRGGPPGARGRGGRVGRISLEGMDVVSSKPEKYIGDTGKRGMSGQPINLLANFFTLEKKTDWCIYNYRVDFKPEEDRTPVKKMLLRAHAASIGAYIFDGSALYVATKLNPDPMVLYSMRDTDNEKIELSIRLVQELVPGDVMYLQFFNITVRKCLSAMKLEELGRHYYDRENGIKMPALRLELWRGYITSLRNYEKNVLLNVEITHKVLRQESVLNVISQMRGNRNPEKAITDELVGTIVMTHYNRKTYRIDDIDWDSTPGSTFDIQGTQTSYADYYRQRYKLEVTEMRQPMLISRPKKRDVHRGMTGPIVLVPEFCQMTGLSDAMRANFSMMRELAQHLHMGPQARVQAVDGFMKRLKSAPAVNEDLDRWGLQFSNNMVSLNGRVVPGEPILFAEGQQENPNRKADWTMAFRNKQLLQVQDLVNWVLIVPQRDAGGVDGLIRVMQQVSRPLNFNISQPQDVMRLPNIQIQNYVKQIDQAIANYAKRGGLQLIFIVLPSNKLDTYSAVKRRCVVDYGISSQCYLAKNVQAKGLMAIATKCVVQMSAKLGGEPWKVQNPLKTAMVIGFDVHHCGKRKGASVGAMVATTSPTLAKYYSTVSFHNSREELSSNLCSDITKCVHAYEEVNNFLPDRIIMYRDGVGDGQLTYVYNTELGQIKDALHAVYSGKGKAVPKFSFIISTKKINTRLMSISGNQGYDNPEPGTIVDDVITLPERYDFYLISQCVRQGTVSPTAYNVLFDEQGLKPDQIQRLTYKLCHMYFNWSGTVAVPAPCQYAHKLSYLTGLALQTAPNEKLSHLLYYL